MLRSDVKRSIACAMIVAAAFLLVWPFAEMSFNDDWSYVFSVREYLRTGHVIYNGWASPTLLLQIFWGALFSRLFGFSFTTLRFSTLPFAAGSAGLLYLLSRKAGVSPGRSIFCSLLIALSPLMFPLSESFMTDVPTLCMMLLSIYALVTAALLPERSFRPIFGWIVVGTLASALGGIDRQTGWIPALMLLPYVVWLRRRETGTALIGIAAWVICVGGAIGVMAWFNRQPYAVPLRMNLAASNLHYIFPYLAGRSIGLLLTCTMLLLPAILPLLPDACGALWRSRFTVQAIFPGIVLCGVAIVACCVPATGMEPWLTNTLGVRGLLGSGVLSGTRPISQPMIARILLTFLSIASFALLLAWGALAAAEAGASVRAALRYAFSARHLALKMLVVVSIVYLGLVEMQAITVHWIFDRYALPLLPCLAILFCRLDRRPRPRAGAKWSAMGRSAGYVLFAVYVFFSLATTQDLLALGRARHQAILRLEAAGLKPNQIAAGEEWDNWAQLVEAGHVNNYLVVNPAGSYDDRYDETPAMWPQYRIEFEPTFETRPSSFGTVDYFSMLPPFHRRIYIRQYARSSDWSKAHPAAGPGEKRPAGLAMRRYELFRSD